ncbi:hypothetical protein LDL36_14040 [Komagataeibacter sp. FNDCR1]|nr:hypothetical protein [Komagataeibacter sp. FNDCR1]
MAVLTLRGVSYHVISPTIPSNDLHALSQPNIEINVDYVIPVPDADIDAGKPFEIEGTLKMKVRKPADIALLQQGEWFGNMLRDALVNQKAEKKV